MTMTMIHEHVLYSEHDGLFLCRCGVVRLRPGKWASAAESKRMRRAAARETARLKRIHGTAVDGYGQRLRG